MINRNQAGEFLEEQEEIDSENYLFALDILKYISQYCDVAITQDDIRYFSRFLDGIRYMNHGDLNKNAMVIQMVTRQYISSISAELGINLKCRL